MSVAVSQHKNYVGGEWVDSAGGETMEVLNPATGETIAEVPTSTEEDANRAVEAAKAALPEWLDSTPRERAEILLKLADVIEANAEDLARARVQERRQAHRRGPWTSPARSRTTSASSRAPPASSRVTPRASTCASTRP